MGLAQFEFSLVARTLLMCGWPLTLRTANRSSCHPPLTSVWVVAVRRGTNVSGWGSRIQLGRDDPFTRSTDGAPRHPEQSGDRGLVHPCRQPGEQIIKITGQMGARPSERDALNNDTMMRATKASQGATHLDLPHPKIKMPPS